MKYKAILFDMDGTLVDSLAFHTQCFERFFSGKGLKLSFEQVQRLMGPSISDIFGYVLSEEPYKEAFAELKGFYNDGIEDLLGNLTCINDAEETLKGLQALDMHLGLITNTEQTLAEKMLRSLGLMRFETVSGGNVDNTSKTMRCFDVLCAFDVQPAQALYVGDCDSDAQMAKEVGMDCCLVQNDYSWQRGYAVNGGGGAVLIVKSLKEVFQYIEQGE